VVQDANSKQDRTNLAAHLGLPCHTAEGIPGRVPDPSHHSAPMRELAACGQIPGETLRFWRANRVMARCGTAVIGSPDMLELTLHRARNNKGVSWTVLRLIVTDLHVHAHDFQNVLWLTCRRGGAECRWGALPTAWRGHGAQRNSCCDSTFVRGS
jgi:hypothetical protein